MTFTNNDVGKIFMGGGRVYRCISYCDQPQVCLEPLEGTDEKRIVDRVHLVSGCMESNKLTRLVPESPCPA